MASNDDTQRLERARIEQKIAQSQISEKNKSSDSRQFLNLIWLTQSRLEYAILLIRLSYGLDSPPARLAKQADYSGTQTMLEVKNKIDNALTALDSGDIRCAIQDARFARDLLRQGLLKMRREKKD